MEIKDYKGEKDNQRFLERCFKLLEYLRKNTDHKHAITQKKLREDTEIKDYLGNNETFNRTIRQLANTLNFKGSEVRPEDEWVLVYKAFAKYYGENGGFYDDNDSEMSNSVRGIYFNHIFTDDELTAIINALNTSKAVSREQSDKIICKLKNRLAPDFYKEPKYKLEYLEYTDSPQLAENICIIQQAISERKQISFVFNYYNKDKRLAATKPGPTRISPYYIVSDNGRFYLIGSHKNNIMYIYRIDLMTSISISTIDNLPIRSEEKHKIRNMPQAMSEEFKARHLNMSYEAPITAEFKNNKKSGNGDSNYTFIHDYFGNNFDVVDLEDNIVRVRCSKFGIINFAIQFGEYVEVLDEGLRKDIAKRVKQLSEKY